MIYLLPLLSVIFGYAIATFFRPKTQKNLRILLAFSGSFLLALTVSHLLPSVYESAHHAASDGHVHGKIGFFIMFGIVFQIILEYFSHGAEHGHVHRHETMYHIPWSLFISLCLHALLEGMPVSHHNDLAWGIAIHHFPIAIILTTFFTTSHLNKPSILVFMFTFAAMTPLGTVISEKAPFITHYYAEITAFVIGILFHISSTIIFETSEGHKFNMAKLSAIILGIVLAYFM